ncbi:MAG TPA: TasA family protein [Symbiobacteriaceae bacterium]|nr:TasA family protein [Symbiobacteriaceae bacterium]
MKKKLLLASAAFLAVAVGVGTTFALFSDSTSSTNNLTAGTLCLSSERNDGDPVPGPMFYITPAQGATPPPLSLPGSLPTGYWAPGDQHTRTLTIFNPISCSSMNAWLTSVQATMHPGGYLPMADKLWVEILTPQGASPGDVKVGEGWLSTFFAGPVAIKYPDNSKIPLNLTANRHMKFRVKFSLDADNSYQGQTLVVDFKVNAEQMPNNP